MLSHALLFLLPIPFLVLGWAVGRVVTGGLRGQGVSEPTALFVGFGVMLAVLSNLTFLGLLGTRGGTLVALAVTAALLVLGRRHLRAADWREPLVFALVPLVAYAHFLWPLFTHPGTDIALMYAGDFNQYVALGTWLQDTPITVPADLDLDYNTLQANVMDHQRTHLRIGAMLFLGFYATLGLADVPTVYTMYCGLIVGLQALAVALLARRLAPGLPRWTGALAGVLYGLSPTAAWAAYASFVPQTLGLAFLVAAVVSLVDLLDAPPAAGARDAVLRAVPTGLLFFAAWSCYPEAVPLAALVILCFVVLSFGRRLATAAAWRGLALSAAGVLGAWILASPVNFWWGVQGILVQLRTTAHGGEQIVTPWTLFGTMVGAMQQPLIADAGAYSGQWFQVASIAACALALAGMLWLLASRQRALPLAIAISSAILFAYIVQRYSFERNGAYPAWKAMLSWNLYKAAAFVAPYAMPAGIVGVLAFAYRFGRRPALAAAAVVVGGLFVSLALRQDAWSEDQMSYVRLPEEARTLMAQIPPGRLLLDVHTGDPPQERYQRYTMYALLADRPFLSTRDGQPPHLYALFDANMAEDRKRLMSQPFQYVLTDRPTEHSTLPRVAEAGGYSLLDARGKDFQVTLRDYGAPPLILVNFASGSRPRELTASVLGAPPGSRVLYNAFGATQAMEKQERTKTSVLLTAPQQGGLAQFVVEPTPPTVPVVTVRDGFVPSDIPMRIDLVALMQEAEIAGDAGGARLAMLKEGGSVRLDQQKLGTSRVRVAADLYPGEYALQVELGDVRVDERDAGGFGAFLGEENNKEATIELLPGAHTRQTLRVLARQPRKAFFQVGFGAWGRARGSIEIKSMVLVRRPD